jgi:hypothetical protein
VIYFLCILISYNTIYGIWLLPFRRTNYTFLQGKLKPSLLRKKWFLPTILTKMRTKCFVKCWINRVIDFLSAPDPLQMAWRMWQPPSIVLSTLVFKLHILLCLLNKNQKLNSTQIIPRNVFRFWNMKKDIFFHKPKFDIFYKCYFV